MSRGKGLQRSGSICVISFDRVSLRSGKTRTKMSIKPTSHSLEGFKSKPQIIEAIIGGFIGVMQEP